MPRVAVLVLSVVLSAMPLARGLAGSPVPLKQVAPLDDILLEVTSSVRELDGLLASSETYDDVSDEVGEAFGVLACMGQAIAEHADNAQTPIFGPALREAALAYGEGDSHAEATAALAAVKAAQAGGGDRDAPVEYAWEDLFAMYPLMDEMEDRGGQLSKIARRPSGKPEEAMQASTFAILSLVTCEDTSYISDEDIPAWQKLSLESQDLYTQLATAIRAKDRRQSDQIFKKAAVTCIDCHKEYRD